MVKPPATGESSKQSRTTSWPREHCAGLKSSDTAGGGNDFRTNRENALRRRACPPRTAAEVIDLHAVLRAGLPRRDGGFPGDEKRRNPRVVEAADGRIVGCVTLHPNTWNDSPAWQLRGMATDPLCRDRRRAGDAGRGGAGGAGGFTDQAIWCNARVPAAGFTSVRGGSSNRNHSRFRPPARTCECRNASTARQNSFL